MPVRKVASGYKWGNSGKVYPTEAQAARQGRAIYASGYADGGIASLIPLNARTFFRNLMRDKGDTSSILTPEDFSPEQIELMYKQIDEQDRRNAMHEAMLVRTIDRLEKSIIDPSLSLGGSSSTVQREQEALDSAQKKLASYETTRDRTSVSSYKDRSKAITGDTWLGMPDFLNTVRASFTSPAYNIGTILGRYTAYKNKDGSVTVKDKYNWNWHLDGPEGEGVDIPLSEFISMMPDMIRRPEALGNILMRTLFKDKQSPVEFTLPPRQKNTTTDEMPENFREGGRVRLI